jgi:hypothetical protein
MPIEGRDPEFIATVTAIYRAELGREPDPGGLKSWVQHAREGWTGEQIRQAIHDSPEAVAYRARPPKPPPPTLSRLHVEGLQFVTDTGQPWIWAMTDGFRDYDRFLRGEDIRPVLDESQALGANGRRVLGMVDSFAHLYPQEHPDYYDRLPAFLALNAERGQYVQFCVFADTKIILPRLDDQLAHYARVGDALRPFQNAILQLVNENSANQNGIDLRKFAKPDGLLASIGSNGTGEDPPLPAWDYSDLGSERRGDFALSCTTVYFAIHGYPGEHGAPGFAGTQRATVVSEPPGFAEVAEPGRRTADPHIAYLMGLGCRWGAGGTAHSSAGIQSELLPPTTKACVSAFLEGVKGLLGSSDPWIGSSSLSVPHVASDTLRPR